MSQAGARARRAYTAEDELPEPRPRLELVEDVPAVQPAGERRTVRISGQPTPPRRRRSTTATRLSATPDRLALYAVLLGLFLVFMAVVTAPA